ncbi:MAG: hypothetical protein ACEPO2_21670 [Pelagibaca sp.]
MNRLMIATALVASLGTAGFAATEAEMDQIENFDPSIDTSSFSESDFDIAYGIVTSGMSRSEKAAKLRALESDDNMDMGMAMISEAELERLQDYAPGVDFGTITQNQAETALAISYSGVERSVAAERVQQILGGVEADPDTLVLVDQGREAMIQSYVPEANVGLLTEDERDLAVSFIHSSMSRSEKIQQIEALIN